MTDDTELDPNIFLRLQEEERLWNALLQRVSPLTDPEWNRINHAIAHSKIRNFRNRAMMEAASFPFLLRGRSRVTDDDTLSKVKDYVAAVENAYFETIAAQGMELSLTLRLAVHFKAVWPAIFEEEKKQKKGLADRLMDSQLWALKRWWRECIFQEALQLYNARPAEPASIDNSTGSQHVRPTRRNNSPRQKSAPGTDRQRIYRLLFKWNRKGERVIDEATGALIKPRRYDTIFGDVLDKQTYRGLYGPGTLGRAWQLADEKKRKRMRNFILGLVNACSPFKDQIIKL